MSRQLSVARILGQLEERIGHYQPFGANAIAGEIEERWDNRSRAD